MTDDYRSQLTSTLGMKETEELLDIWQTNDRVEWSDSAFDVIREILTSRGVELPEQDEAVLEHPEEEEQAPNYGFTSEELEIIDDENPPDFYDPLHVLQFTKWLDWIVIAYVLFVSLYHINRFPYTKAVVESYFSRLLPPAFIYLIAIAATALSILVAVVLYTLLFKVLAQVLRILMQMEFNSRKGGSTGKTA